MNDISAIELKDKLEKKDSVFLLDVREKLEFYTFNIGGQNIPLGQLSNRIDELPEDLSAEIVVICQKGIRSRTAQTLLIQAGYTNIKNLKAGLSAFHRI
jgi:rhodanese-related sulfurtransferase